MAAETFFARWSRRKAEATQAAEEPAPAEEVREVAPPTLEQVAALTVSDDFTPFVARGVDETVRRAAMKKLFSDPHFNVMDGLDTYIEDYNKFEPMTPAMIAALNHAKDLLDPLAAIAREHAASAGTLPPQRTGDAAAGQQAALTTTPDSGTQNACEQDGAHDARAATDEAPADAAGADNLQATSQEADEHANQSL